MQGARHFKWRENDDMKVLVCGGRKYFDRDRIFAVLNALDEIRPIHAVIEGGATGADSIAGEWAKEHDRKLFVVKPDYEKHSPKVAPLIRNTDMLQLGPELVVAFPGGNGTADMMKKTKAQGIPLLRIGE